MEEKKKVIVVDGNNVLRYGNNHTQEERKVELSRLMMVVKDLLKKEFDVIPIVSARIRHIIDDPGTLEELISNEVIIQTPAGTDDDAFGHVKRFSRRNQVYYDNLSYEYYEYYELHR